MTKDEAVCNSGAFEVLREKFDSVAIIVRCKNGVRVSFSGMPSDIIKLIEDGALEVKRLSGYK